MEGNTNDNDTVFLGPYSDIRDFVARNRSTAKTGEEAGGDGSCVGGVDVLRIYATEDSRKKDGPGRWSAKKTKVLLQFLRQHETLKRVELLLGTLSPDWYTEPDYLVAAAIVQAVEHNPSTPTVAIYVYMGIVALDDLASFLPPACSAITDIHISNPCINRVEKTAVNHFRRLVRSLPNLQSLTTFDGDHFERTGELKLPSEYCIPQLDTNALILLSVLQIPLVAEFRLSLISKVHPGTSKALGKFLTQYPTLRELCLNCTCLVAGGTYRKEGLSLARTLKSNASIREIECCGWLFAEGGMKELLTHNSQLKRLEVRLREGDELVLLEVANGLILNKNLEDLRLKLYGDLDLLNLVKGVSLSLTLKEVHFRLPCLTEFPADYIAQLIRHRSCTLKALYIQGCEEYTLSDTAKTAASLFKSLERNTHLERFHLLTRLECDADYDCLVDAIHATILQLSHLRHLSLAFCRPHIPTSLVTHKARLLDCVKKNTSLESIIVDPWCSDDMILWKE